MCACARVCTCLWALPCLPSQNKSHSVERCHKLGSSSGGTGQLVKAEVGAQACPWGQAKARCQNRRAQPGTEHMGSGFGRSAPNWVPRPWGRGGQRSITREGWAQAWNSAHLSRRGLGSREKPKDRQGLPGVEG